MTKKKKLDKLASEIYTLRYGTSCPTRESKVYFSFKEIASLYHGLTSKQIESFCHRRFLSKFSKKAKASDLDSENKRRVRPIAKLQTELAHCHLTSQGCLKAWSGKSIPERIALLRRRF